MTRLFVQNALLWVFFDDLAVGQQPLLGDLCIQLFCCIICWFWQANSCCAYFLACILALTCYELSELLCAVR